MSFVLDFLVFATGWGHIFLAPYTKVEESFNLHAVHDVLFYGTSTDAIRNYDHNIFPGAVPRTFIGSVLLAWLSQPAINLASHFEYVNSKFDLQIIVRLVLASVNALGLCLLRRAVSNRFGRLTGFLWVLLTCSQFHLVFWMGRTLPNMFSLFPVNVAFYFLFNRAPMSRKPPPSNVLTAISLLTFAGVVFRSEIALLLAPIILQSFRLAPFTSIIKTGLISALLSIVLTTFVDSYFWSDFPLWPELYGLYFNVYQGKSSEWGISPFRTYFTSFLPKLLLSSAPLSILGALVDSRILSILLSTIAFILLISNLGHKEWRFIIYTVPVFNIAAARGARSLVKLPKNTFTGRLALLLFTALLSANCAFTYLSTTASVANYPGGTALVLFNAKYSHLQNVHVHISNLAAQSGASLFLQTHADPTIPPLIPNNNKNWVYDKTETLPPTLSSDFTHLIAEYPIPSTITITEQWKTVECIDGFDGWTINWDLLKDPSSSLSFARVDPLGYLTELTNNLLRMRVSRKLCILERAPLGGMGGS